LHFGSVGRKLPNKSAPVTRSNFHTTTDSIVTYREESNMAMQSGTDYWQQQLITGLNSGLSGAAFCNGRTNWFITSSLIGAAANLKSDKSPFSDQEPCRVLLG